MTPRSARLSSAPARHEPIAVLRLAIAWGAAALTAALLGCSKSDHGVAPVTAWALSGHVELRGNTYDQEGFPQGERTKNDVDGLRVYLLSDTTVVDSTIDMNRAFVSVVDSTVTSNGDFVFVVPAGNYRAIVSTGPLFGKTEWVSLHGAARSFATPLVIASSPQLVATPNPFFSAVSLRFTLPADAHGQIMLLSGGGTRLRTLADQDFVAGAFTLVWDGRDAHAQPVPAGAYWLQLTSGTRNDAVLVFKDPLELSGTVVVRSRARDEVNTDLGALTFDAVSGLRVHLDRPGGGTDSVNTSNGHYHFPIAAPGDYRVWLRAVPGGPEIARTVTLGSRDSTLDTLVVTPFGQLDDYPNPFASSHGVGLEYDLAASVHVSHEVWSPAGARVWHFEYEGVVGLNHVHWIGIDDASNPAPNGYYWAVVRTAEGVRYNMVLKQ